MALYNVSTILNHYDLVSGFVLGERMGHWIIVPLRFSHKIIHQCPAQPKTVLYTESQMLYKSLGFSPMNAESEIDTIPDR